MEHTDMDMEALEDQAERDGDDARLSELIELDAEMADLVKREMHLATEIGALEEEVEHMQGYLQGRYEEAARIGDRIDALRTKIYGDPADVGTIGEVPDE